MTERKQTITVSKRAINTFGDLEFTDTENKTYKIGKARVNHFDSIEEGAEVILTWVENPHKKGTDYIYSAEQTGKHGVPEAKPLSEKDQANIRKAYEEVINKPTPQPVQSTPAPIKSQSNIKDRAVAISYSKDLVIGKIIPLDKLTEYADKFLNYIERGD